jgi:hypothetical protein
MPVNGAIAQPVDNDLVRTSWGIDITDTSNWNYANKLNLSGGTVTGATSFNQTVTAANEVLLTKAQGAATPATAATRKDYVAAQDALRVAKTGDTMTGALVIDRAAGSDLCLRLSMADPYMDFTNNAGTQIGYIRAMSSAAMAPAGLTMVSAYNVRLNAAQAIRLEPGSGYRGQFTSTNFMWGKETGGYATNGIELFTSGVIYSTTPSGSSSPNVLLRHNGNVNGESYIQFSNNAGEIISHIAQDTSTPVGTTFTNVTTSEPSDYRLKNDLGKVTNAVRRLLMLVPRHLSWKADDTNEFDGFFAHEVAAVVPDAVQGEKDEVYTADEAELMGVEEGDIKPQQLSLDHIVPLIVAAVQELTGRVEALEAS